MILQIPWAMVLWFIVISEFISIWYEEFLDWNTVFSSDHCTDSWFSVVRSICSISKWLNHPYSTLQIFRYLHDVRHVAGYSFHKFHALYTPASLCPIYFHFDRSTIQRLRMLPSLRYELRSYLTCIWRTYESLWACVCSSLLLQERSIAPSSFAKTAIKENVLQI